MTTIEANEPTTTATAPALHAQVLQENIARALDWLQPLTTRAHNPYHEPYITIASDGGRTEIDIALTSRHRG